MQKDSGLLGFKRPDTAGDILGIVSVEELGDVPQFQKQCR
jgi:hypothetical protein